MGVDTEPFPDGRTRKASWVAMEECGAVGMERVPVRKDGCVCDGGGS